MVAQSQKISQEMLEGMFEQAQSHFDIDGDCAWSFFFTDRDPEKLKAVAPALESRGYRVLGLLGPDSESDDSVYFLQVERQEHHTVASLLARNDELYAFAEEQGLESYDGMDVGPLGRPGS